MEFSAIASGSSGNCIYVKSKSTAILIDAGITGKRIVQNLSELGSCAEDLQAVLVTHEHRDHISGVGVMARKFGLAVYANGSTWAGMNPYIGPIPERQKKIFESGSVFCVGDLEVTTFRTSHDSRESVGFIIDDGKTQLAIATDTGVLSPEILGKLKTAEYLLIESNHDLTMLKEGRYPWHLKKRIMSEKGHLSNKAAAACVEFLVKHGRVSQGQVLLGHLSQENNLPDLALKETTSRLLKAGIKPGSDVRVGLALRDRRTALYKAG
ncbi:MAG: MBL fold metallo-hydrolase [Firmicutes bacterium]|nr:MBL fold metallo-hydrolase [Bacillota bacterium]